MPWDPRDPKRWTTHQDQRVRALAALGQSSNQIAIDLSETIRPGTSKNAVIGRCQRIMIPLRRVNGRGTDLKPLPRVKWPMACTCKKPQKKKVRTKPKPGECQSLECYHEPRFGRRGPAQPGRGFCAECLRERMPKNSRADEHDTGALSRAAYSRL